MKEIEIEMDKKHFEEQTIGVVPTPIQDILMYHISKSGAISFKPIILPINLN